MKKIWIIVVIILIVIAVLLYSKKKTVEDSSVGGVNSTMPVPGSNVEEKIVTPASSENAKVFTVDGGNFYFKPNIIKVHRHLSLLAIFTLFLNFNISAGPGSMTAAEPQYAGWNAR